MSTENFTMLMELGNNVVDSGVHLGFGYIAISAIAGIINNLISLCR
jgi:hypothetical protein